MDADPAREAIKAVIYSVRGKDNKRAVYAALGPGQKALFAFYVLYGHTAEGYDEFLFYLAQYREMGLLPEMVRGAEFFRDHSFAALLRAFATAPEPDRAAYAGYLRGAEGHRLIMARRLAEEPEAFRT